MVTVPTRSCLVCRRRGDKPSLVRLVAAEGVLTVDEAARMPGRGAYLCDRPACMDTLLRTAGAPAARALRLTERPAHYDGDALRAAWETATRHNGGATTAGRSE